MSVFCAGCQADESQHLEQRRLWPVPWKSLCSASRATEQHEAGRLLLQATGRLEGMMPMIQLLLELGGDPSRVNVVGNDLVAIAASIWPRSLWGEIRRDEALLARCTARHAGRVALQLFAGSAVDSWADKKEAGPLGKGWCGESLLDSL